MTLIKNGILITQNSDREIVQKNITIENGKIIAIDNRESIEGEVIDADGYWVQPGFIQPHVHLSLPNFKKSDEIKSSADLLKILSELSKDIIKQIVQENIQSLLAHGTTTVLAMEHPLFTGEVFQEIQKSELRAFIGNGLLDHGERYSNLEKTMQDNMTVSREILVQCNNSGIHYVLCPWSIPVCSGQLWREIAIFANDNKLLVHTHACETKGELRAVKYGRSSESVTYLDQFDLADKNLILAHCVWLTEQELEILQREQVQVVHCPSSNEYFNTGTAPVIEMIYRKINVCLSTDGAFCNTHLDMFEEMRKVVSVHGGDRLDTQTVFDMATVHGAKALGMENEIGSIEIGKRADLIILELPENTNNPISTIVRQGNQENIKRVMVNGNTVFNG